jgi:galactose mutarotase-like enzyme
VAYWDDHLQPAWDQRIFHFNAVNAMSKSHEVITREGRTLDVLTDDVSGTRLMVAREGAEPVSLARRTASGDWRGFLYRDGDLSKAVEGWNNHATVMGYYLHRIVNERSLYRGHEIRGGTHSFLRHKTFQGPEARVEGDGCSLTYTMTPAGYEPVDYPFAVLLRLTYSLDAEGALRVHFHFENQEQALSTHVSFGLHPGFAVGSLEDCEVRLPAGLYRRLLAPGNFLSGESVEIDHPGGPMPFAKVDLPGSFLLDLAGVPDRKFTLIDHAGGRQVTVECPEAPFLTLWSDGHDFVCIEPCWGLPDMAQQTPFEQKPGIQEIAPGGTLDRSFTIRALLA